jgi:hypothetical protein
MRGEKEEKRASKSGKSALVQGDEIVRELEEEKTTHPQSLV